jgi:hypothetical protein
MYIGLLHVQKLFPHYLINGTIFEKRLLNTNYVFLYSLQLLSETFVILKRILRHMIKNVYRSAAFTDIFPHYLINGTIFEKRLLNTKCVPRFSLQLSSETFLILRRFDRDMMTNVYRSAACTEIFFRFISYTARVSKKVY